MRGPFDVVAIATSLGGPLAARAILSVLPCDFPVPILLVQHRREDAPHLVAPFLQECTRLIVRNAKAHDRIRPGAVYVAPAGRHMRVRRDFARREPCVVLTDEPKHKFCRPAADLLFSSVAEVFGHRAMAVGRPPVLRAVRRGRVAEVFGHRAMAVVLTGLGSDGAAGAAAIRLAGGSVLVQSPQSAEGTGMPEATIRTGAVDLTVDLPMVAAALISLNMCAGAAAFFGLPRSGTAQATSPFP